MDEHLVEYILETLDPVTARRLETSLEQSPELRAKRDLLRRCLAPLAEDADNAEPPKGLALAALARVAEHRCALPKAPVPSKAEVAGPSRRWFGWAELVVAASVLLLMGGLALPALMHQWHTSQRQACMDNLRRFHASLAAYADTNDGNFPRIAEDGNLSLAGMFVPMLRDAGHARDVSISCPAHGRQAPLNYTTADLDELARTHPVQFTDVSRQLGGHYAYCLGYHQGQQLCGLRRDSGDLLPIMADRPSLLNENSPNHGGGGQNVLFVGGHVRWYTQPEAGVENDHIYINHERRVRAGVQRVDTVLGISEARPAGND